MQEFKVEGEPKEVTEIRSKIIQRFKDLEFIEKTHQYFLPQADGTKLELKSVSHITHQFQEPFDSEAKAEAYALKHGETKEYWMDQWKYNSLKATTLGTMVHCFSEGMSYIKNKIPQLLPDELRHRYIKDKNWLIPVHPKEEAALKFWNEFPENLWWVLSETKVYTNKYAGTFDLLGYYKHPQDDNKSGLIVLDYKTNASLSNDYARNFNKRMYAPFTDLYDESLGAYTLQLSAYQIPLEDMGLKVIARRIIHLKDDKTYELVPVENKTKELREVLEINNG